MNSYTITRTEPEVTGKSSYVGERRGVKYRYLCDHAEVGDSVFHNSLDRDEACEYGPEGLSCHRCWHFSMETLTDEPLYDTE
ncbi:MAG: hypothetical protein FWH20_03720 [Oscillospiraceae bacterium]|nr:hypothetical protein [Oscillospiraceae bacterium]